MTALADFFAMGGYAGFIWTAYGIVAVVLAGLAIASRRELRARQREIEALEAASPRRRARGGESAP
jgi:heme exporter protein D